MESVLIVWRLTSLLSPLGVPLLLGVLAYFRLRNYQDLLAHLAGFLVAPILTFYFLRMMFVAELLRMQAEYGRPRCGMPMLGAAILIFTGTGFQILLSLVAQLMLHGRER